jgi:two-component system phosphate regulon sensor histidine kinase PhoR
MTRKIFKSIFTASLIILVLTSAMVLVIMYEYSISVSRKHLKTELDLAAQGVERDGMDYLKDFKSSGVRVTWIDSDGRVLFDNRDNDTAHMENHLKRPEVKDAVKKGYGESERYSTTIMERLLYAAKRMDDNTIIRLSVSQYSIWSMFIGIMQPFMAIIVLSVVISLVLATRMSHSIVAPLNDLDLENPLENKEYDELAPLLIRINLQQEELKSKEESITQKQTELDTILSNMQEGMILLKADGTIFGMNTHAGRILGITSYKEGATLIEICRDPGLIRMTENAENGKADEQILDFNGRIYQVSVTPVRDETDSVIRGMTLVFFDVTDKEISEKLRREFTANVSHELKTPLHSISGYAELLKDGVVKTEDIRPFADKIYKESQRTIRMVGDIISLSHLDEGAEEVQWEMTDVGQIAVEAAERLRPEADEGDVKINLDCHPALMKAKPALIREIMANLIDNAIKYNKKGGYVNVKVKSFDGGTEIIVEDNGIGIPKEDQPRIFERFFRVDKSHSREIGGTGLGLSIVKHAVLIHNGSIDLKSAPGEGTKITIHFPGRR